MKKLIFVLLIGFFLAGCDCESLRKSWTKGVCMQESCKCQPVGAYEACVAIKENSCIDFYPKCVVGKI